MQANIITTSTKQTIRFSLGRIFLTHGAIEALEEAEQAAEEFLRRDANLEQGELGDEDYKENLFV